MYTKIHDTFWTDAKVNRLGSQIKLAYLYLLTSPHRNLLGLYRLPVAYMAFDLRWDPEDAKEAVRILESEGFITYDRGSSFVLVKRFLKHNRLENPNQTKAALAKLKEIGSNPLLGVLATAIDGIDDPYLEPLRNRLETLLEGLPNKEEEKEEEKEKEEEEEKEGENRICGERKSSSPDGDQLPKNTQTRTVPYGKIVDLYNELCPGLRKVVTITDDRKKKMSARWHTRHEFQTIDFWASFWNRVWCSDWLCGRVEGHDGKTFTADFDWCLRPRSFSRIVEGKYDPKSSGRGNGTKNRMDILSERDPQDILRETFAPRSLRDDGIETVEAEGADHDQR